LPMDYVVAPLWLRFGSGGACSLGAGDTHVERTAPPVDLRSRRRNGRRAPTV
jgi:hypothetical protein